MVDFSLLFVIGGEYVLSPFCCHGKAAKLLALDDMEASTGFSSAVTQVSPKVFWNHVEVRFQLEIPTFPTP